MGLVLLLGFFATGSGYNGLYLSLSLGLGILIISGMLSERVMKSYSLRSVGNVNAEPNIPFRVSFEAVNESHNFSLYGVENLIVRDRPKFKLFSTKLAALAEATAFSLLPNERATFWGDFAGLPRGLYQKFLVVQRTIYPFGLLSKFKLSEVPTRIIVPPAIDPILQSALRADFRSVKIHSRQEQQFHSHRPYLPRDSLKYIDWKKNAGLPTSSWVIKVFDSQFDQFGILLEANWEIARMAVSAEAYENYLSRLRTAAEVVKEFNRPLVLQFAPFGYFADFTAILNLLVCAPPFSDRDRFQPKTEKPTRGWFLRLTVGTETYRWSETAERLDG